MNTNARYKGGSGTGVDLTVLLADGQQRPRHVDPGEVLPETIGDIPVYPAFIAGLLEQNSEWELVGPAPEPPAPAVVLTDEERVEVDAAIADGDIPSDEELAAWVAENTIPDLLKKIGDDAPLLAKRVLIAELARDTPRETLISALQNNQEGR